MVSTVFSRGDLGGEIAAALGMRQRIDYQRVGLGILDHVEMVGQRRPADAAR